MRKQSFGLGRPCPVVIQDCSQGMGQESEPARESGCMSFYMVQGELRANSPVASDFGTVWHELSRGVTNANWRE